LGSGRERRRQMDFQICRKDLRYREKQDPQVSREREREQQL
jgi:hypothetical protein